MPTRIPITWDSVKAVEKWLAAYPDAAYPDMEEYGGELLSAMATRRCGAVTCGT